MPDSTQHGSIEEAVASFQDRINIAVGAGRWMAAVWHIDEHGKIIFARTTFAFPTGDFKEAIRGLEDSLWEETGAIPTLPGVLPIFKINQGDDDAKVDDVGIGHPVEELGEQVASQGDSNSGEDIACAEKLPARTE